MENEKPRNEEEHERGTAEPAEGESAGERRRFPWARFVRALVLVAMVAAQVGLLTRAMPLAEWFNADPIVDRDYAYNFYNVHAVKNVFAESGRFWGYDPHFMAGYPVGTISDINNKLAELLAIVFRGVEPARVFKIFCLACIALAAPAVYLAARNFGLSCATGFVSAALVFAFWNTFGEAVNYQAFGMVSFLAACYASLWTASLYFRALGRTDKLALGLLFVVTPILFSLHVTAVLLTAMAAVPLSIAFLRRSPKKVLLVTLIWALLVLAANLWWIRPMVAFWDIKLPTASLLQPRVFEDLGADFLHGATWYLLIVLCGFAGLYHLATEEKGHLAVALLVAGAAFLFLGYFGGLFEFTKNLEPKRFKLAAAVMLAVPAAAAFAGVARNLAHRELASRNFLSLILTLVGPVYIVALTVFAENRLLSLGDFSLSTRLPEGEAELVAWIRKNTRQDDRIAFEDRMRVRPAETLNLSPLLPFYTDREFVGGPNPRGVIRHNEINFFDKAPAKKGEAWRSFFNGMDITPKTGIRTAQLMKMLDQLGIRVVVAQSTPAIARFDKTRAFRRVARCGRFVVYRRRTPLPGPRYRGDYDRIHVETREGGTFVLPYHWQTGLSSADAQLRSRRLMGGKFLPFVEAETKSTADRTPVKCDVLFNPQ